MRYIYLFLIILSFNAHAQVAPSPFIPMNPPSMPDNPMYLGKYNLEMIKFNAEMARINSIDVTAPNGIYGGNGGISFRDLGMTSQSFGQVLSSMSMSSNMGPRFKLVERAKPDAANYIVSDGNIHGAYLEQAFMLFRKQHPDASDMELAEAILAY